MEELIVFRVEDADGRGPYSGPGQSILIRTGGTPGPIPEDDGLPIEAIKTLRLKTGKFGFATLEQLHLWFSKEQLEQLEPYGYRIVQKRAKHVWFGNRQVIFIPLS